MVWIPLLFNHPLLIGHLLLIKLLISLRHQSTTFLLSRSWYECSLGILHEDQIGNLLMHPWNRAHQWVESNQLSMVAVEITKGIIERTARSDIGLNRASIREPAQFGGSLGIAGSTHASPILRGFIESKHPRTGTWLTFGLTCYHCVVPPYELRTDPGKSQSEIPVAVVGPLLFHTAL